MKTAPPSLGGAAVAQQLKPVEHALQDEGGRGRIDPAGALAARHVHLDQRPLGRDRRQPLVPEQEGQVGEPRHVAHEGARGLRARPSLPSMLIGSPITTAPTSSFAQGEQRRRVGENLLAPDDRTRMGEGQAPIGDGDADRLVAEVEPGERPAAGSQARGSCLDGRSIADARSYL